tara:strand:+ start:295 stop:465 length:171 start_codon:yes stop_codon:yes gene_type:complete
MPNNPPHSGFFYTLKAPKMVLFSSRSEALKHSGGRTVVKLIEITDEGKTESWAVKN